MTTPPVAAPKKSARRRRSNPPVRHDRSVGVVLYRETVDGRLFLVLFKRRSTDFAKGHVETGETDAQAAIREVAEETGITDVELHAGYLGTTAYTLRKGRQVTRKAVAFFLGRTAQEKVIISHEHERFAWLSPEEAVKKLSFENQRNLVKRAQEILTEKEKGE